MLGKTFYIFLNKKVLPLSPLKNGKCPAESAGIVLDEICRSIASSTGLGRPLISQHKGKDSTAHVVKYMHISILP
jgi:hypothetical protein